MKDTQRATISVISIGCMMLIIIILTLCTHQCAPTRVNKSFVKVHKYDNPKDNPNNLNITMPEKPDTPHYKLYHK